MQAVILAAGRGTRMGELTEKKPKPLLEVSGKTLLEHKFDAFPDDVSEIIIVVGYLGDMIRKRFGGEYKGRKITYVEQGPLHGTAGALWSAKSALKDRFVVMMGDDLYSSADILHAIDFPGWALLIDELEHIRWGGCIMVGEDGRITDIEEGNHSGKSGFISANLFVLDTRIFEHEMVPKAPDSTEFGLPQTALLASRKSGIPFDAVKATFWIQITDPEDLKKARETLEKIRSKL
ncbi:hypothetical protein A3F27_03255 [Candidatus Kaiserbacteria bacterium RIFCSPHIGHO2_12_FULL_53_13]|uniref:Nucleotidyl transferase domain-containing protein n=1 Tax=Candidatus Kaiserbacteria bacterium RIFCSPHIGHO2_12_FULL_53_13 TaxID=1798502 RepID=A0A1F6E910_9BACT|nr:MAG: hypothetical protein A3F27_03255 [Candidatus Kaiserbacteria bacterium RIFCSPHIGHO2_12_FULL_53_13]OGG74340.1 MAG: hypothetical protein A3A37_02560 [Candidatus Kaiserbacteria bacterium RIFCSPLOWO2_01_FULL_52_36]